MLPWSTTVIIIFAVLSSLIIADDPCRFDYPSKGVIDLTSLGRTNGKTAYPDTIPATGSNYKYSYNPCKPFSEGSTCVNAAVCQVSLDVLFTFLLGKQDSVKWDEGASLGANPSVSYSFGEKRVVAELVCSSDETNIFEALDEEIPNNYGFRLTDKCACWNGCTGKEI